MMQSNVGEEKFQQMVRKLEKMTREQQKLIKQLDKDKHGIEDQIDRLAHVLENVFVGLIFFSGFLFVIFVAANSEEKTN